MRLLVAIGGIVACVVLLLPHHSVAGSPSRSGAGVASASRLAHGRWRVQARSPLGPRANAAVVWTGRELIEAGGSVLARTGARAERSGATEVAAFDPRSGRWRRLADLPDPSTAANALAVWTQSRLFLLTQGSSSSAAPMRGAVYDPAANRWTVTPPAPISSASIDAAAVAHHGRVLVATVSGALDHGTTLNGARYDPLAATWSKVPIAVPRGHDPAAVAMVDTRAGPVLWSSWSRGQPTGPGNVRVFSGVDVYRLVGGRWHRLQIDWPQHRTVDQPLSAGSRVLLGANQIWCGVCPHPAPVDANGWTVDPMTLRVSALPHGPLDDLQPQIQWSGAAQIALNAGGDIAGPHVRVLPGAIAFLDLRTRRWYRGPRAAARLAFGMPAQWDGSSLLALAADGRLLSYGNAPRVTSAARER